MRMRQPAWKCSGCHTWTGRKNPQIPQIGGIGSPGARAAGSPKHSGSESSPGRLGHLPLSRPRHGRPIPQISHLDFSCTWDPQRRAESAESEVRNPVYGTIQLPLWVFSQAGRRASGVSAFGRKTQTPKAFSLCAICGNFFGTIDRPGGLSSLPFGLPAFALFGSEGNAARDPTTEFTDRGDWFSRCSRSRESQAQRKRVLAGPSRPSLAEQTPPRAADSTDFTPGLQLHMGSAAQS
jgi:hypothetical protein